MNVSQSRRRALLPQVPNRDKRPSIPRRSRGYSSSQIFSPFKQDDSAFLGTEVASINDYDTFQSSSSVSTLSTSASHREEEEQRKRFIRANRSFIFTCHSSCSASRSLQLSSDLRQNLIRNLDLDQGPYALSDPKSLRDNNSSCQPAMSATRPGGRSMEQLRDLLIRKRRASFDQEETCLASGHITKIIAANKNFDMDQATGDSSSEEEEEFLTSLNDVEGGQKATVSALSIGYQNKKAPQKQKSETTIGETPALYGTSMREWGKSNRLSSKSEKSLRIKVPSRRRILKSSSMPFPTRERTKNNAKASMKCKSIHSANAILSRRSNSTSSLPATSSLRKQGGSDHSLTSIPAVPAPSDTAAVGLDLLFGHKGGKRFKRRKSAGTCSSASARLATIDESFSSEELSCANGNHSKKGCGRFRRARSQPSMYNLRPNRWR